MPSVLLCFARIEVATAEAAIRTLAKELHRAGHVKESFESAAVTRERRSPTGLPFDGGAVALPHAEPDHVVSHGLAVATLAKPVRFREMGSPATQLDVALVVMPALTSKEQAAAGLTRIIEMLQDAELRAKIAAAADADALRAIVAARWTA